MKTIKEYKKQLSQIKDEVLIKSNESSFRKTYYYYIALESVEEDIALWKKGNPATNEFLYFYTDLDGNLLFNGENFFYATPFSNSRAFVRNYRGWFVLDIKKKEIVCFSNDLIIDDLDNINKFRNDELAVFDGKKNKWGSLLYNEDEHTFEKDIPFIWDALDFSRLKNEEYAEVYIGLHNLSPICSKHPYDKASEDFGSKVTISVMRAPIFMAKTYDYYNNVTKTYKYIRGIIKDIEEEISSTIPKEKRIQKVKEYLQTAQDICDWYFEENCMEKTNNNSGKIVDVGNIEEYPKKLGKIIK